MFFMISHGSCKPQRGIFVSAVFPSIALLESMRLTLFVQSYQLFIEYPSGESKVMWTRYSKLDELFQRVATEIAARGDTLALPPFPGKKVRKRSQPVLIHSDCACGSTCCDCLGIISMEIAYINAHALLCSGSGRWIHPSLNSGGVI